MGLDGIEPSTSELSALRSNRLSYSPSCAEQGYRIAAPNPKSGVGVRLEAIGARPSRRASDLVKTLPDALRSSHEVFSARPRAGLATGLPSLWRRQAACQSRSARVTSIPPTRSAQTL